MPVLFRSVRELKERTPQVLKDLQGADVVVTVHGNPMALLRRFTEEELGKAIANSEAISKGLTAAVSDLHAGRTTSAVAPHRATAAARRVRVKRAARGA